MVEHCLPILAMSTIAVVPIVRSVFECGVVAQWLRWVPGSEIGLMDEARRLMEAATKDLSTSESPRYREAAAKLRTHGVFTEWPSVSEDPPAYAAKVGAICLAFYGGRDRTATTENCPVIRTRVFGWPPPGLSPTRLAHGLLTSPKSP
jgi:hypothetical protein